jgi:hypothetical protein
MDRWGGNAVDEYADVGVNPSSENGILSAEQLDTDEISAVADDCGTLAMECSDVHGFVIDVSERISANLKTLDQLENLTVDLLSDQGMVAGAASGAHVLAEEVRVGWSRAAMPSKKPSPSSAA